MSDRRIDLSKYFELPEPRIISVATRYHHYDIRNRSSIDYGEIVKHEAVALLVRELIKEDLVEFNTRNASDPFETTVEVRASIKVYPRHLKFKLEGLI
jgi:hypothetical protein